MVATSVFLPYEVYDLTVKITWLRVAALMVNLLLVVYLVWTKRLFGVCGGKAAYEARLRSESLLEVERAALAAAGPRTEAGPRRPRGYRRPGPAAPPADAVDPARPAANAAALTPAAQQGGSQ